MKVTVKVEMKSAQEILERHGLTGNGNVQRFHTMNVNRRIGKYMPHLSGALETKSKRMASGTEITILAPYAKYQYYGKVMVGSPPKILTGRNLQYTKDFNPLAGPYWDRALVAAEGEVLVEELQAYITKRGGK